MNRYKLKVRRYDGQNYEFIVNAEYLNEARSKVLKIAEKELPYPEEKEIIIELDSVEILDSPNQ